MIFHENHLLADGSRTKQPGTKHPMTFLDTPDKTSHKDLPARTKHPMLILSPRTKHPMPFLPPRTKHPMQFLPPRTKHPMQFLPPRTKHPIFLGYFLVQTAWTNHPTFWVGLDRVHVTIIFL